MPSPQSRNWVFTWNNPPFHGDNDSEVEAEALEFFNEQYAEQKWSFLSWQLERGESGTLHVQGYVQFAGNKRLASLRHFFPGCHAAIRRGTHEEAVAYTSKDESRAEGCSTHEIGEPRNRPGRRRDLENVIRILDFNDDFAEAA